MYPLIVIRYADDTIVVVVIGFQRYHETRAFLDDRKERMRKFELALHPDKTRLIRFGRHEFCRPWHGEEASDQSGRSGLVEFFASGPGQRTRPISVHSVSYCGAATCPGVGHRPEVRSVTTTQLTLNETWHCVIGSMLKSASQKPYGTF
jgi:hypothetical protein